MADIFLSHSKQDREVAKNLALSLKVQGWTVWWDKALLKDKDPHQVGLAEVRDARLVIVIWSKWSVSDAFVLEEAIAARDANKLFMVSNPRAPPKHIPLLQGKDRPPEISDLMQISMTVSSLMRKAGVATDVNADHRRQGVLARSDTPTHPKHLTAALRPPSSPVRSAIQTSGVGRAVHIRGLSMGLRAILELVFSILLLAAGMGLIYWSWLPLGGREWEMILGVVLLFLAGLLLFDGVSRFR